MKALAGVVSSVIVAAVFASMFVAPAPAKASEIAAPTSVRVGRNVVWVETSLPKADVDQVDLRVFAPEPDGGRTLWQWCKLQYVGPGTYRCGVDISSDTKASRLTGTWAARIKLDGDLLSRTTFRLEGQVA